MRVKKSSETPCARFECHRCQHSDYRMSTASPGEETRERCPRCGALMTVTGRATPDWLSSVLGEISKYCEVEDFVAKEDRMEFEVCPAPSKSFFLRFLKKLKERGYICAVRTVDESSRLYVVRAQRPQRGRLSLSFGLLAATALSTFLAGRYLLFGSTSMGILFSFAIISMLGAHELAHMLTARKHGIQTSPPFFIPFPSALGTMGAIIEMREPPPSRDAMVEVGSAGPIAGFIMAVVFLTVGLILSSPAEEGGLYFSPLLFVFLRRLLGLPHSLNLHPFAYAGWVMQVVTMLNLMPLGQLDGGHVARAVLGPERHFRLTRSLSLFLFLTGFVFPELPFWVWGFLAFILFSREHPGPLDDVSPIGRAAKVRAGLCFLIFILCLPTPGW